jgi:hypothetical protein
MHSIVSIGSRHWQLNKAGEELLLTGADLGCGQVHIWSESCTVRVLDSEAAWHERRVEGIFRFQVSSDTTTAIKVSHQFKQPMTLQFCSSLALALQGYPAGLPSRLPRVDDRLLLKCRETFDDETH